MAGITSYGAYVPCYRLKRDDIAKAWVRGSIGGERAVANFDEDSITMAVEAGTACLKGIERNDIDRLYFATTTAPYMEKQGAALIAAALDLPRKTFTMDFCNSLRCGTSALRAALEAVDSGAATNVLLVVADSRQGFPSGDFEQNFGDGAAAILIGKDGIAVDIEGICCHSDDFIDYWRTESDKFVRSWEDRFVLTEGYVRNMREAVSAAMKQQGIMPKDVTKVAMYGPDQRSLGSMVGGLGFDPKTQLQDPMFATVGNTGSAFALMMLAGALEQAKAGDRIMLAGYGDGCDVYFLKVTDQIEKIRDRRAISYYMARKRQLPSYEKLLAFRNICLTQASARPTDNAFPPAQWRQKNQLIRLYGLKCRRCGTVHALKERVCYNCKAKDEWDEVRLSDLTATLYTFILDNLSASLDPPTPVGVSEFENGCRVFLSIADCAPDEVKMGMKLEPTFRKIHDGAGLHNYFWKLRPIREV